MNRRFDDPRLFIERHEGWYWVPHVVFTLAVLAVLVALAVWLVTTARRHPVSQPMMPIAPPSAPPIDPALQEARMRYARGELSREDYLRIAEDLGGPRPPDGS